MKTLPFLLACIAVATVAFAADDDKDFKPLFNGKDLTGWHVRKPDAHNAWKVEDGVLKNDLKPGEHGVDLITDAKFWNFTVRYEYRVPKDSNSGFYLRGRHELQILGDHERGKAIRVLGAEMHRAGPGRVLAVKIDARRIDAVLLRHQIDHVDHVLLGALVFLRRPAVGRRWRLRPRDLI